MFQIATSDARVELQTVSDRLAPDDYLDHIWLCRLRERQATQPSEMNHTVSRGNWPIGGRGQIDLKMLGILRSRKRWKGL